MILFTRRILPLPGWKLAYQKGIISIGQDFMRWKDVIYRFSAHLQANIWQAGRNVSASERSSCAALHQHLGLWIKANTAMVGDTEEFGFEGHPSKEEDLDSYCNLSKFKKKTKLYPTKYVCSKPVKPNNVFWQQLLETLYTCRPNMSLIVSDFDALPDVKVEGVCAPLVSRKVLHVFNYPCTKTFYYHHKIVHYISLYLLVWNLNPAPSGFRESGYGVYIILLPLRFFQKLVFSYAKMMLEQKDGSTEDLNSYLDVKACPLFQNTTSFFFQFSFRRKIILIYLF